MPLFQLHATQQLYGVLVYRKTRDLGERVELRIKWIDRSVLEKQVDMAAQRYCACGNGRSKDPRVLFHRFPNQRMHPRRRVYASTLR